MVIGAPIVMAGIAALWMPRFFIQHVNFVYVLGALIVVQAGQTIQGLNGQAWGAELSEDYHERTRIQGWRTLFAALAPAVAFGIPLIVERSIPHATNGDKLFYLACVILVLLPLLTLLAVFTVPETPSRVRAKAKSDRLTVLKSWKLLLSNRTMLRLVVIDILAAIPFSISTAVNFFYTAYVLKAPAMQSTLLLLAFFVSFVSMPVWIRISRHFEKHKLLAFTSMMTALLTLLLFLWGPGDVLPFAITISLIGIFSSGPGFLLPSIVADVVDSDTLATGEQRTGTFYALTQMTAKFAPTVAVMFVFPYLQWAGFDPSGHHNTPQSIMALKYAFVFFPPIPFLAVAWLLWTFPIGRKEQEEMRRQIRETHGSGGKSG